MRIAYRLSLLTLLLTASAFAEPLPDGWPYRRPVAVKAAPSDAPGDNLAWTEFHLNGSQKPDASDIRVTTADRQMLPFRILQQSPDHDLLRIAFPTKTGDGTYYVWWGHPKPDTANAKPADLDIKRGCLVEIFRFPGGSTDSEPLIKKAFERAGKPDGALFVPSPFLGHNPLGSEDSVMFRYSGQFRLEKDEEYELTLGVDDVGTLAIDGQKLFFVPRPTYHARHAKTLDLKAGWHTLEATQINFGGPTGIVIGYRKPGAGHYNAIPPALFAPIAEGTPGPLETLKQSYTADCTIEPTAEAFSPPETWFPRYFFEAKYPDTFKPSAIAWDFGDGQTSSLAKAHHYYLTPGIYTVTLTLKQAGNTFTAKRRIQVQDRAYSLLPRIKEDEYKTVRSVLENYNPHRLTGEQRFRGMSFFERFNDLDMVFAWGKAWLESQDPQPEDVVWEETYDLARRWQGKDKLVDAAEAWRLAAEKPIGWATRVGALRQYVLSLCDYLDEGDKAYRTAEAWRSKSELSEPRLKRVATAAMAYAAIAKGEGKWAAQLAKEAAPISARNADQQRIEQGVLTRNIENYISGKDFDAAWRTLNGWELDYPEVMTEGFTRLLRVKLLVADAKPAAAARVAMQHAKACPTSFYAAELLFRAAEAYRVAQQPADADKAMQLLKSKYPESPYARNAGNSTER